jgi:hypothetical protein
MESTFSHADQRASLKDLINREIVWALNPVEISRNETNGGDQTGREQQR